MPHHRRLAPAAAALLLLAAPAAAALAQPVLGPPLPPVDWRPGPRGLSISAGLGHASAPELSGDGRHLEVSVPVTRFGRTGHLRAEGILQRSSMSGGPPSCSVVARFYCLGRAESRTMVAAGVAGVVEWSFAQGRLRPYLVPTALGAYHSRVRGQESQGPTGMCIEDSQIVSCADNPPFASFDVTRRETTIGGSSGAGVGFRIRGIESFAELRAHQSRLDGRGDGAVLFSIGAAF